MTTLSPGTAAAPTRRKSASSAAGGIGPALVTDPHVDLLVNGSFFTSYHSNITDKKMDIYIFYQAEDAGPGCLYYWDTASNSVAPGSLISLGRITDVIKGKRTPTLANVREAEGPRCLAILFGDNGLHLEADTDGVADGWVRGLAALISVKVGRSVTGDAPTSGGLTVNVGPAGSGKAAAGFTIHPSPSTSPPTKPGPSLLATPPPPSPPSQPTVSSSSNGRPESPPQTSLASPTNGSRGLGLPGGGKHPSLSKSMSLPKSQMQQLLNGASSPETPPSDQRKKPSGGAVAINWNATPPAPIPAPGPAVIATAAPVPAGSRSPLPSAKR